MTLHIIITLLLLSSIYLIFNNTQKNIPEGFISLENYPELKILEENFNTICDELNNIIKNGYWSNYDELHGKDVFRNASLENILIEMKKSESKINNKTKNPKWKMFGLIFNKEIIEEHKKYCPKTVELLKSIPYISNAGFSCLEPNKATDIHSDDNDIFYRYQLPLFIPEGDTGFKVNNSTIQYKLNQPFIFDDCYLHQAWNYTNQIRIVLICDIDRKT
jgi:beta-hydroxylase